MGRRSSSLSADIISRLRARSKTVFYGWRIVAAGFLINAFGVGTFFYGFSTFFNPLMTEFGWSRTLLSGVFSLSRLEGGIEGPIAGWLTDRFGARKILLVGVVATGVGFLLLQMVGSPGSLYVVFGFAALGFNIGYVHATSAAVAKWFIRKRGRAMATSTMGSGLAAFLLVPLVALVNESLGWREAWFFMGVLAVVISVLPALLIRTQPEDIGLLPDGMLRIKHSWENSLPDGETIESVRSQFKAMMKRELSPGDEMIIDHERVKPDFMKPKNYSDGPDAATIEVDENLEAIEGESWR